MTWSVFLLDEKLPLPVESLSHILQEGMGGIALDHHHTLHLQHGWIARGVDQPVAERLVALLEDRGHPALSKREDRLVGVERRFVVTGGELRTDALLIQENLAGSLRAVPWESLAVVALGSVPVLRERAVKVREETRGVNKMVLMTTGIPLRTKKAGLVTRFEKVEDEGILLHLVVLEDPALVLEIRPVRFDYHYLGDRIAGTPAENFRLLLDDLARFAGGAHWTDMSRRFLQQGILEPEFTDEKDFLRYTRWITEKTVV
jgi:hypothetical protein